jgi:hypothetical protein
LPTPSFHAFNRSIWEGIIISISVVNRPLHSPICSQRECATGGLPLPVLEQKSMIDCLWLPILPVGVESLQMMNLIV